MNPEYKVEIRGQDLELLGEIGDYTKLNMILRFNDVSKYTIEIPLTSPSIPIIKSQLARGGGRAGIIVTRNGTRILTGPFLNVEENGEFDQFGNNVGTLTIEGADDNFYLLKKLAVPKNTAGEYREMYNGEDYSVQTGSAETVMKWYVDKNIGPSAYPTRKLLINAGGSSLSIEPDKAYGSNVTGRARFQDLLSLLQSLAIAGGWLGFKIVQTNDGPGGTLEFQVYEPIDQSDSAIFSASWGTLRKYSYRQEAPEANFFIIGGGGTGAARTFYYSGDEPSRAKYGTWETFVDRRDTTSTNDFAQEMTNQKADKGEKINLKLEVFNTSPTELFSDYFVGDIVRVEIVGVDPANPENIVDRVQEAEITVDSNGEVVIPKIGSLGVGTNFRLFDKVKKMERRISYLEKRQ